MWLQTNRNSSRPGFGLMHARKKVLDYRKRSSDVMLLLLQRVNIGVPLLRFRVLREAAACVKSRPGRALQKRRSSASVVRWEWGRRWWLQLCQYMECGKDERKPVWLKVRDERQIEQTRDGGKKWNYLHNEKMKIREGRGGGNGRIKPQYACGIRLWGFGSVSCRGSKNADTYLGQMHRGPRK